MSIPFVTPPAQARPARIPASVTVILLCGCTPRGPASGDAGLTAASFAEGGSDDDGDGDATAASEETAAGSGNVDTTTTPGSGTSATTGDDGNDDAASGGTTAGPPAGCNAGPSIVGVTNDGEYNHAESFPIRFTFDDDLYATSQRAVWASPDAGAQHEHLPDGGWDGCGAARFWPPSIYENMSGIGQILDLREVMESSTLAIRYCISAGASFAELSSGAKPIILWRAAPGSDVEGHDDAVGSRPMVISRPDPEGRGIAYGLCDGTVCTYVGGDFWPDGSDTWLLSDDGWSCLEFDFDLANDEMQLFVTTQDGRFHDTPYLSANFRDEASGPGGVFTAIDIVGGYFAQATSDPDNYYTIDDLVVDVAHIGPPPGFAE